MTSELELIYTIHNIVRGGEYNADDAIQERLMRQFISIHRGKLLNQAYKKGDQIPDEVFQSLGTITFSKNTSGEFVSTLMKKIIRFEKGNYGLRAYKDGFPLPVLNEEEYRNSVKDKFNKYHPKLKFINNRLYLNLGLEQNCYQFEDQSNTSLNTVVRKLKQEEATSSVKIDLMAVLVNLDDDVNYNWLSSPYPLPDELIESMINSVNAREFNLFLRMKSDETGDIQKSGPIQPNQEI